MPAAVLFDLDETLLDRTTSLMAFLADQYSRFALRLGDVDQDTWRRRFIELDARGSVPKTRVYPELLHSFGGDAGAADALAADYATGCCRHARPFSGMADVLRHLRQRGKRLAVVSNGEAAFQRRHIEALGLDAAVDAVLISEAEGVRKPDPAIFRRAAARLDVEPAQCLFVGDNPRADVLGAAATGMQTLWFHCGQRWPEDLPPNPGGTIEALVEVLALAD